MSKYPELILSHVFMFRVTEVDLAALRSLARADKNTTSNYLRNLIAQQVRASLGNPEFMKEYTPYLLRWSAKDRKEFDKTITDLKKLLATGPYTETGHVELGKVDGTSYGIMSAEESRAMEEFMKNGTPLPPGIDPWKDQ